LTCGNVASTLALFVVGVLLSSGSAQAAFVQEAGSPFAVGDQPSNVKAADFNGDGRPDLTVTDEDAQTVSVLLRRPKVGFTLEANPVSLAVPDFDSGSYLSAVGDFNADTRPDLAVSSSATWDTAVLLRQAGGSFAFDPAGARLIAGDTGPGEPAGGAPGEPAAADFDGDGDTDIAIPVLDAPGAVSVFLRNPSGFTEELPRTVAADLPDQSEPGDFDGDGDTDLALGTRRAPFFSLLKRRPGGFTSESSITLPTEPDDFAAADFNGDNRKDLVVGFGHGDGAPPPVDSIGVFVRNAANNGFDQLGGYIRVPAGVTALTAGDFNNDGNTDIAVASDVTNGVTLLYRAPGGSGRRRRR
jgi:hypothetical protein